MVRVSSRFPRLQALIRMGYSRVSDSSASPEDISRTFPESGPVASQGPRHPSVQLFDNQHTVDDLHTPYGSIPSNHPHSHLSHSFIQADSRTRSFKTLPPQPVLRSLVDTYFLHAHNQPYSYFQEASFRHKLEHGLLPKCLVFAVLATALRFSDHEYYSGKAMEAAEAYARESWLSVLQDHLTVENSPNLYVVQTTNILAVIDFTGMIPPDSRFLLYSTRR